MPPAATTSKLPAAAAPQRVPRRAPTPPPERKVPQPMSTPRPQPTPSSVTPERTYKVIFIGDASVGKSTFILRVVRGQFVPGLNSTLGMDFQLKTLTVDGRVVTLQLWDTAGQERFRSITQSYFRKADGIVMMYDCTSERSFLNVRHWLDAVDVELFYQVLAKQSKSNPARRVPILLAANKVDLLHTTARRGVPPQEGARLAQDFQAMFVESSAKTGMNVESSMVELARAMADFEDQTLRGSTIHLADRKSRRSCCSL